MPERAVVLDIGGVLESNVDDGWREGWATAAGVTVADLHGLSDVWRDASLGRITEAAAVDAMRTRLGLSQEHSDRYWELAWAEYVGTLNTELFTWFRDLRPGLRTGILSNSTAGAREHEDAAHGFADATDVLVYSHEVGLAKPDPAVYALTAERLGVPPGRIVFLDDTPAMVDGARAAGWQAVRYEDNAQAITAVERLLREPELRR